MKKWVFTNTSSGASGKIQKWLVPTSGEYKITALGAQGGTGSREGIGGLGAKMSGTFTLESGTVLNIGAGQQGTSENDGVNPSGGGASFVLEDDGKGFLSIDDEEVVVSINSAVSVETMSIKASVSFTSTSNMRIVNTPNDELFAAYVFSGNLSFNHYLSSSYNSSGLTINDGSFHDIEWKVNFSTGLCEFYVDNNKYDEYTFTGGPAQFSQLQLFRRDSGNQYIGDIESLSIEINNEPFLTYSFTTEIDSSLIVQDESGNERNGTFSSNPIFVPTFSPLLIAGGGGGYGVGTTLLQQSIAHAHTETWGKDGFGNEGFGEGGINGNGGIETVSAGAGGGYKTPGSGPNSGQALRLGALGSSLEVNHGGFGGGGGGGTSGGWGTAAGGGGYSGGGPGYSDADSTEAAGGGGGSYNVGSSQDNQSAFNEGHGLVEIEYLGDERDVPFYEVFSDVGLHTLELPLSAYDIKAILVSGGGGASGCPGTSNMSGAGGGGGATAWIQTLDAAGKSLSIKVGAGGQGGAAGVNDGSDGEDSWIEIDGVKVLHASGGKAGIYGSSGGIGGEYLIGDGGSIGGSGGESQNNNGGGGGGGAGGYSGKGGDGGSSNSGIGEDGIGGSAGGGGGQETSGEPNNAGGGVGLLLLDSGISGTGGESNNPGGGGSYAFGGGLDGSSYNGGLYGGGGGGAEDDTEYAGGSGAQGAVLIQYRLKSLSADVQWDINDKAYKATVSWDPVDNASNYDIILLSETDEVLESTNITDTEYVFTNLEPKTTFKLKLIAYNISVEIETVETEVETGIGLPEAVTNITDNLLEFKLTISWGVSEDADTYTIQIYSGSDLIISNTTTDTSFTLDPVISNNIYDIVLYSSNAQGNSEETTYVVDLRSIAFFVGNKSSRELHTGTKTVTRMMLNGVIVYNRDSDNGMQIGQELCGGVFAGSKMISDNFYLFLVDNRATQSNVSINPDGYDFSEYASDLNDGLKNTYNILDSTLLSRKGTVISEQQFNGSLYDAIIISNDSYAVLSYDNNINSGKLELRDLNDHSVILMLDDLPTPPSNEVDNIDNVSFDRVYHNKQKNELYVCGYGWYDNWGSLFNYAHVIDIDTLTIKNSFIVGSVEIGLNTASYYADVSPNGDYLAFAVEDWGGASDPLIFYLVYDTSDFSLVTVTQPTQTSSTFLTRDVKFSPNGAYLILSNFSYSADGGSHGLIVIDTNTWSPIEYLLPDQRCSFSYFSDDSTRVFVNSENGFTYVFNTTNWTIESKVYANPGSYPVYFMGHPLVISSSGSWFDMITTNITNPIASDFYMGDLGSVSFTEDGTKFIEVSKWKGNNRIRSNSIENIKTVPDAILSVINYKADDCDTTQTGYYVPSLEESKTIQTSGEISDPIWTSTYNTNGEFYVVHPDGSATSGGTESLNSIVPTIRNDYGDYVIEAFTNAGSVEQFVRPEGVYEVELLIVAGGGSSRDKGDGNFVGLGGGGGGGVLYLPKVRMTDDSWDIKVGRGGGLWDRKSGEPTEAGPFIVYGGNHTSFAAWNESESASGAGSQFGAPKSYYSPGIGNPGGASVSDGAAQGSGGGGGAGTPGIDGIQTRGGDGGDGLYFPQFSDYGDEGWFGGGGGGSIYGGNGFGGDGGKGGGGNGSSGTNEAGQPGMPNTGGGGGGTSGGPATGGTITGAVGGSGIVLIRYRKL